MPDKSVFSPTATGAPSSETALQHYKGMQLPEWLMPGLLALVLIAAQYHNYALFHLLAEIFIAAVVALLSIVGWHAYRLSQNRYLAHIAAGYVWVAALNIAHAITYAGIGVLPGDVFNVTLQFQLASSVLEATLLLTAPLLSRHWSRRRTLAFFGGVTVLLSLAVTTGIFPAAFVSASGPTLFRTGAEYLAILMFLMAVAILQLQRERFDQRIADPLSVAMLLCAASEFAFTNYTDLDQGQILGHGARLIAYWLIYLSIVRVSLAEPFRSLLHAAHCFNAIPDPTVILDTGGVIRGANRAARLFLAQNEAEFIGRHCHEILHPPELNRDHCLVCRQLAAGASTGNIEVYLSSRGQWHEVSVARIDSDAGAAGMVHINRDITRRKSLESALRDSEARFRDLIETTSDWVWEIDEESRITYVSPNVVDIVGYDAGELVGRPLLDIVDSVAVTPSQQNVHQLVEQRAPFRDLQIVLRRKTGGVVVAETSGGPYTSKDGRFAGYRGTSRNITGKTQTEPALASSERGYRTLVENLPQFVVLKDLDGRLVSCNANFARLFDSGPEQLIGKMTDELCEPELAKRFRQEDARIIASGRLQEFTDNYELRGATLTVHVVKSPVTNSDGCIVGVLCIFWDVTERVRAEKALRESQWRYKAILENASDGILVADSSGRFIDSNRRAEALFGYTREEFMRMHMSQIHAPENQNSLKAAVRQMNEIGFSLFEHRMLRKDGSVIHVEVSGTRIALGDSHIYLGNFRDISERKRVELELNNYRDHLEHLVEERTRELRVMNSELEAFSYSVSHDLRSPLRAINGFGEALREELGGRLSEDARHYLDRMQKASNRMAELIDGLLNLSRVIRRELRRAQVDMSTVAGSVAAALQESDPGRVVTFQIEQGLSANGDETLLRVLLENLLNNAWKFTAKQTHAVISFAREDRDGLPVFSLRDNGAGFDMTFAHRLFQPFERLHTEREFQGTGIGLATARRVVERHGGRIWAEGILGKGATIYFSLAAGAAGAA